MRDQAQACLNIALTLDRRAKLVIADINEEAAKKVAEDVRSKGGQVLPSGPSDAEADDPASHRREATHFKCDVTSWDSQVAMFQHAVDTFGKVDVALANAGVSELGPGEFEDCQCGFADVDVRSLMIFVCHSRAQATDVEDA